MLLLLKICPMNNLCDKRHPIPILEEALPALSIEEALEITKGNKTKAAELLGISRMTLYRKLT